MKNPTLLKPLSVVCAAALLLACTEDDSKHGHHSFTGRLSDLTRVTDSTIAYPQWKLEVDDGPDPVLRGQCKWTGYLGDSTKIHGTGTSRTGLYSNHYMTGTKSAEEFRANGVLLSMDSIHQAATLTHYRADFDCEQ
jgi:hypothetical protein